MAGALVLLRALPEKLNPIIRPLMDSLKREENAELQVRLIEFDTNFIHLLLPYMLF